MRHRWGPTAVVSKRHDRRITSIRAWAFASRRSQHVFALRGCHRAAASCRCIVPLHRTAASYRCIVPLHRAAASCRCIVPVHRAGSSCNGARQAQRRSRQAPRVSRPKSASLARKHRVARATGTPARNPLRHTVPATHTYSVKLRRNADGHGALVARARGLCSRVSAMRVLLNTCTLIIDHWFAVTLQRSSR
jgi:hypothetical protein